MAVAALVIVLLVSVPLGMLMAGLTRNGRRKRLEIAFMGTTSGLGNVPDYVTGTVLIFVFAVQLAVLPPAGASGLDTLVLPALAVSLAPVAIVSRMVRLETLNVLAQDYMRTAASKRLPPRLVLFRHALPNVLTAALTLSGIVFTAVIGGVIVIENIFNRPGLGSALVQAVLIHDYPVVQGITLTLGVIVIVVSTVVDVLLAALDPRSLTRQS
jgi:peptide/nickel transport system permease protein